jgi:hypothetical protein
MSDTLFAMMESVAFRVLLNVEKDAETAKQRFNGLIEAIAI